MGWRQGYSVGQTPIQETGLEKSFNIHLRGLSRRWANYSIGPRPVQGLGLETGIPTP